MKRVLWWLIGMVIAGGASAQTWPTTHVRIITAGSGGGSDFVARLLAQGMGTQLGQRVTLSCNKRRYTGNCIGVDPEKGLILQLDRGGVRGGVRGRIHSGARAGSRGKGRTE